MQARDKSVADLEAAKTRVEKKLYKVTDNMVQAQKRWNVAETDLDRLRTDIVEYEEMASSMQVGAHTVPCHHAACHETIQPCPELHITIRIGGHGGCCAHVQCVAMRLQCSCLAQVPVSLMVFVPGLCRRHVRLPGCHVQRFGSHICNKFFITIFVAYRELQTQQRPQ